MNTLITEKYRPKTLKEFIGENSLKEKLEKFIKDEEIPNILFYSLSPGTGKTTLAKMLVNSINCEHIYINASDDNGIDTIREVVKQFASTASFTKYKIVILDEAAKLSFDAQSALLNMIETFSENTRFILTCNYIEKIIEPLRSRCTPIKIVPPTKGEIAKHLVSILDAEGIKYSEDLKEVKFLVQNHYPDMRSMLNLIQLNTFDGELKLSYDEIVQSAYKSRILAELKKPTKTSFNAIRQILADSNIDDYYEMFRYLFDNIDEYAVGNVTAICIALEEYQYHYNFRVDKEMVIMATISKILEIIKK